MNRISPQHAPTWNNLAGCHRLAGNDLPERTIEEDHATALTDEDKFLFAELLVLGFESRQLVLEHARHAVYV